MTVADRDARSLANVLEAIYADSPNGPEPDVVYRAFRSGCAQLPNDPERWPSPTSEDWKWLGRYIEQTGQTWIADEEWWQP